MKKIIIFLLMLLLLGCASYTVIKTLPDGAKVKKGEQLMGITPYEFWDRDLSYTETTYTLQMEGYKDRQITITKNVLYIHRLILPPILGLPWLFGYQPTYFFDLEKAVKNRQRLNPEISDKMDTITEDKKLSISDIPSSSHLGTKPRNADFSESNQKLRELRKLKDEGLLTEKEYEKKRKEIVEGI